MKGFELFRRIYAFELVRMNRDRHLVDRGLEYSNHWGEVLTGFVSITSCHALRIRLNAPRQGYNAMEKYMVARGTS